MSLALNKPKQIALRSMSNTTSEHTPQVERKMLPILYAIQLMENLGDHLPTRTHIELKG